MMVFDCYATDRARDREADGRRAGEPLGHRDATAILLAFRHGLRASELVALRWDDIDFATSKLHVRRSKGGLPSVHPLGGKELGARRRLHARGSALTCFGDDTDGRPTEAARAKKNMPPIRSVGGRLKGHFSAKPSRR